jgi:thermitase
MQFAARSTRYLVLVVALLVVCSGSIAHAESDPDTRLLVNFSRTASADSREGLVAEVGARDFRTIPQLGVHVLSLPASRSESALAALRRNPLVNYAEADSDLAPQELLPNDPYFLNSGAWNLGGGAWGWYATHTTQAWDITTGDPSVVIAILDTGIRTSGLTDFTNQIASTWNVLNNSADATTNAGNHGTYVAGVAGLAMGNGTGNAGYCPGCRLMIVQVGTDSGASLSNLAAGLIYAADHGARVANLSWAGSTDSTTLHNAINYAHDKGMVIFAAVGNSNCNCASYPAADKNVLGIAGVSNLAGDKQGDSNYGTWVKLAAPEGNMTAWPSINGAPGYAGVGGTSMAAPAAAGIAGLLLSHDPHSPTYKWKQPSRPRRLP